MKFNSVIDLLKNELQNARIQNLTWAPSAPVVGQIYTDTTGWSGSEIFYMYIGTGWVEIAFMTRVLTKRLDQFASPNTSLSMNSQKITSLADGTANSDAVNLGQLLAYLNGTDWKASARAISTSNITLSGTQTIDGVSIIADDRVLVAGQTTASENGIYLCKAGAWERTTDADGAGEVTPAMAIFIEEGTTYADTQWRLTNNGTITVGSTNLVFAQFGASVTYNEGTGIDISGSVVSIDTAVTARGYSATFGDTSATSFNIDHNLNSTRKLSVSFIKESNGEPYQFDWTYSTANRIIVTAPTAPWSNEFRVTVFAIT